MNISGSPPTSTVYFLGNFCVSVGWVEEIIVVIDIVGGVYTDKPVDLLNVVVAG